METKLENRPLEASAIGLGMRLKFEHFYVSFGTCISSLRTVFSFTLHELYGTVSYGLDFFSSL